MPNICTATIKVRGYKRNVDEFIRVLNNDYSYMTLPPKVDGFHFFRVFEAYTRRYEPVVGIVYVAEIDIDCAWSVFCSMMPGQFSYYDELVNEIPPEYFKGTNLIIESKRLNLEIEVYSQELGMMFCEHYHILQGGIKIADEEWQIKDAYYLYEDNYKQYLENWGDDDRIHNEEEYQALKSQADENGELIIGGLANTDWTMLDEPSEMVRRVMYKEVNHETKQQRWPHTKNNT